MRPSGTPHELEDRRLRALRLLEEGFSPVEVARQIGVDRRSVRRWKAASRKGGTEAVAAKPASGRPRRLTARDLTRLRKTLMKGALAAGLPTDLWTCPRVAWLIQRQFGIEYHPAHVSRVLHGLGFSPQKPTRRSLERDEERIQAWITQDWPRVKNRCAPECDHCFHRRIRDVDGALGAPLLEPARTHSGTSAAGTAIPEGFRHCGSVYPTGSAIASLCTFASMLRPTSTLSERWTSSNSCNGSYKHPSCWSGIVSKLTRASSSSSAFCLAQHIWNTCRRTRRNSTRSNTSGLGSRPIRWPTIPLSICTSLHIGRAARRSPRNDVKTCCKAFSAIPVFLCGSTRTLLMHGSIISSLLRP